MTSWLDGWLESEDAFVDRVVAQTPGAARQLRAHRRAERGRDDPVGAAGVDPLELEAGANRCALSAH